MSTLIEITLPLLITVETFALPSARQERVIAEQRAATLKWLQWHLGPFGQYGLLRPLTLTLTRLSSDLIPPEELSRHLESTRQGITSWVLEQSQTRSLDMKWQCEQRLAEPGQSLRVEMSLGAVAGG